MPRYTVIHNNQYMHFSGIVDAPLTYFMNKKEFKEYYINEYSELDWEKFEAGKKNIMTLEQAVICFNLNRDVKYTKEKFLELYGGV